MEEKASDNESDEMLQAIRRELTSIIENEASVKTQPEKVINKETTELVESVEKIEYVPTMDPEFTAIGNDIKKMQLELDKTYELFRTIADKFENIDFSCLGKRIRDLSLLKIAEHSGGDAELAQTQDIRKLLDESFRNKTLNKLTETMSERFSTHPGEFGDIPEVSHFFQYCTQLQHGLQELQKQNNSADDLGERVAKAAESKYERIDEIQQLLKKRHQNQNSANTKK